MLMEEAGSGEVVILHKVIKERYLWHDDIRAESCMFL